jgi:antitoxin component YwqK of YwqJK toxin-antitoxin module
MSVAVKLPSGEVVTLDKTNILIGQDADCDICLSENSSIKPHHARIRKMANRWLVESQGDWSIQAGDTDPGTTAWIQPGDLIRLTPDGPDLVFQPKTTGDETRHVRPPPTTQSSSKQDQTRATPVVAETTVTASSKKKTRRSVPPPIPNRRSVPPPMPKQSSEQSTQTLEVQQPPSSTTTQSYTKQDGRLAKEVSHKAKTPPPMPQRSSGSSKTKGLAPKATKAANKRVQRSDNSATIDHWRKLSRLQKTTVVAGSVILIVTGLYFAIPGNEHPTDTSSPQSESPVSENDTIANGIESRRIQPESQNQVHVPTPDFSDVDYSVEFSEDQYKYDFSDVDYSRGPNGEQVDIFIGSRDIDGKSHFPPRPQDEIASALAGINNSKDEFVLHGASRDYGRNVRPLNRGVTIEYGDDGKPLLEFREVLEAAYFFNGKSHGTKKRWSSVTSARLGTPAARDGIGNLPGQLFYSGIYVNDQLHGKEELWQEKSKHSDNNRQKSFYKWLEQYWRHGKQHGPLCAWHQDGSKAIVGQYKNGQIHGKWQWWNTDGRPTELPNGFKAIGYRGEAYFFEGKPHGRVMTWNKNGQKSSEVVFIAGKLVERQPASGNTTDVVQSRSNPAESQNQVPVPTPDFSNVDYLVDYNPKDYEIPAVDYSKGPNGEPSVKRDVRPAPIGFRSLKGSGPGTESGFLDKQGEFVRNGTRTIWYTSHKKRKYDEQQWFNGELYGKQERWDKDGNKRLITHHLNGKIHAEWTELRADGSKQTEQYWTNGTLHGPFRDWYENGQLANEGCYKHSKKHGKWVTWYEHGQVAAVEEFYLDGERHGTLIVRANDGTVTRKTTFLNGKLQGIDKHWYKNGKPKSVAYYLNDDLHGSCLNFHANGQKERERTFANGVVVGNETVRRYDGSIQCKRLWEDGVLNGRFTYFAPDGNVVADGRFLNGSVVPGSSESMTKKHFMQTLGRLGFGYVLEGRTRSWMEIDPFVATFGKPVSDNEAPKNKRWWAYRCSDGVILLTVAVTYKGNDEGPDFSNVRTVLVVEMQQR